MNDTIQINPAPLVRRFVLGLVLAVAAALALPALGQAHGHHAKFAAALNTSAKPEMTKVSCTNPNKVCTWIPEFYDAPPHVGNVPNAPKDGVVTKIKLRSATAGALHVQFAKTKGFLPGLQAKIKEDGPTIHYQGKPGIQTFNVHVPVHKGEWLAIKAKALGAIACNNGNNYNLGLFTPALNLGDPFTTANDMKACTPLVQAIMG